LKRVVTEIVEPTLKGARHDGLRFRGILFIGLMLTADGPKFWSTTFALAIRKHRQFSSGCKLTSPKSLKQSPINAWRN
jgi:hypothetical protein